MLRFAILAVFLVTATSLPAEVTIDPQQRHTNEFSGREIIRSFRILSDESVTGRFVWNLSRQERVLARGEQEVHVRKGSAEARLKLQVDALREDIVMPVTLTCAVVVGSQVKAKYERRLWFFHSDPFSARQQWLRSLDIRVFDPESETANIFREAAIPFNEVHQLRQVRSLSSGTLVIGSQVSQRDYPGLATATLMAAQQGARVLSLARDVAFPLELLEAAGELAFADASVISQLDEQLDANFWSGSDGTLVSRLRIKSTNRRATIESGEGGWAWMEARWSESRGRFIYCGFPLAERWDDSPTPRNLFLRILERLHTEEPSR